MKVMQLTPSIFVNFDGTFDFTKLFQFLFLREKLTSDVLTLSTTFYDLSVSRNLFETNEMSYFRAGGTVGLRDLPPDECLGI